MCSFTRSVQQNWLCFVKLSNLKEKLVINIPLSCFLKLRILGSNTCANVRCAGPCEDTPNGPICRPRNITDVCSGNPCGNPCQRCIPEPKQCFTTPCPQYRCEQITGCLGPPIRPNKPGNCPKPGIGICVESCQTDASCQGSQKCCSNGCGRVCTDPINLQ